MNKALLFSVAIVVFIAIYGGMHYYLYLKLIRLLPNYRALVTTVLVVLGGSIFFVEFLVHGSQVADFVATFAWLSFTWMGLVYLFFVVSVPFDVLGLLSAKIGFQGISNVLASTQRVNLILLCVMLLAGYGIYAAQQVTVERVTIKSSKLPQTVRIVQITDLHLGMMTVESYLQDIVNEINKLNADVIVSTGDLVDMQLDHIERFKQHLMALKARHGKYAVYGNHEMLAGLDASRTFTEQAGFSLLSNGGVQLKNAVTIVGVDDPGIDAEESNPAGDEAIILSSFPRDSFTILLKHQPRINDDATGYFDLQLSGHTHGGQLFPFALVTWLAYQQMHGLTLIDTDTWLYVSRGTGTWGPAMRVLASPEITIIDLIPERVEEQAKIYQ